MYYAQPATYYVTGSYPNGFTPYVSYNAYNYGSPYGYNSPYGYGAPNGCIISPLGDGNACNPDGYSGYGAGPYAPQQIQGLVVGKTGTLLMVLGGNGLEPTFVNDAPALQNGAASGPVAIGQIISAYGFYSGNMFEATALM